MKYLGNKVKDIAERGVYGIAQMQTKSNKKLDDEEERETDDVILDMKVVCQ